MAHPAMACAICASHNNLQICSGCRGAWYCGAEHQKANWRDHKTSCKGVQTAKSSGGIHKEILTPGTGPTPVSGATIACHYVGKLPSGRQFDASTSPFRFKVGAGEVIKGWDKTLINMKEGEKCIVYLTPENAYGSSGAGMDIPPNCPLVFEITLLSADASKKL